VSAATIVGSRGAGKALAAIATAFAGLPPAADLTFVSTAWPGGRQPAADAGQKKFKSDRIETIHLPRWGTVPLVSKPLVTICPILGPLRPGRSAKPAYVSRFVA